MAASDVYKRQANQRLNHKAAAAQQLPEGEYLSLSVTDSGIGIAPEVMSRVFEPFFTTKQPGEGTGLGLSMVYGFAKQSGGWVRIYSEVERGTTVCIYLPRHHGVAEPVPAPTLPSLPVHPATHETVLVVDDEPSVRLLIVDILQDMGYKVLEAADSAAGLALLQSDVHVDLLISDVGLPGGMNGRQMAEAGRVNRPAMRVLFLTGYAQTAVFGCGQLDEGVEMMTKPFNIDALSERVDKMLAPR